MVWYIEEDIDLEIKKLIGKVEGFSFQVDEYIEISETINLLPSSQYI